VPHTPIGTCLIDLLALVLSRATPCSSSAALASNSGIVVDTVVVLHARVVPLALVALVPLVHCVCHFILIC
jgi:hypothetical protein